MKTPVVLISRVLPERRRLKEFLENTDDFEVVFQGEDTSTHLSEIKKRKPELAVIAVDWKAAEHTDLLFPKFRRKLPDIDILVVTALPLNDYYVREAAETGVHFVQSRKGPEVMLDTMRKLKQERNREGREDRELHSGRKEWG